MRFLSTEEGRVGSLAGLNLLLAASVQTVTNNIELVLRLLLLLFQVAVAGLTAWYVYKKARNKK